MKDPRYALIKVGAAAVKKAFQKTPVISAMADLALEFPSVWASTGSLSLDRLFSGVYPGGIPMGKRFGRIIHIPGAWSTGKSLLLDHVFMSVIVHLKGLAKVTETEGSRDPHFANAISLPLDMLSVDRPDTFEQAFDMFESWHEGIRKEDPEIPIVWGFDSLDSTEAEKSAGAKFSTSGGWHYGGGRSEILGAGLRRMAKISSRYPTTLIMLNQTRDNVGVFAGPKKTTPGGNPPHFYASLEVWLDGSPRQDHGFVRSPHAPQLSDAAVKRLGLYGIADKNAKGAVVGRYIRARVSKTKMGTTFDSTADFYIDFAKGVHKWEGITERLYFERKLDVAKDGASDYRVRVPDGNGELVDTVFESKREWLNWLSKDLTVLNKLYCVDDPEDKGDDKDSE